MADRQTAERYIQDRVKELRNSGTELGPSSGPIHYDATIDAHLHEFASALVMYHDGHSRAFALVGPALTRYRTLSDRAVLGYLVSDESTTTGRGGRKHVFCAGAIYVGADGRAVEVTGQTYLAYEGAGESANLGFPVSATQVIAGGSTQEFQRARLYHATGTPLAHRVHGTILTRYLASGGPVKLGLPTSDQADIVRNGRTVGSGVELRLAGVYGRTGGSAFTVVGDFWRYYHRRGGPAGALGFPVSAEAPIPGVSGPGRCQRFEHATVLWFGERSSMLAVSPFRLFIGRVDSDESDPWPGQGSNDIYFKVTVTVGGRSVHSERVPKSGDFSRGSNVINVNHRIPVELHPAPTEKVTLKVEVFDADEGDDDHLGTWTHTLTAADGWGLATNGGVFKSGSFSDINSITAAHQPAVDVSRLTAQEMFWGVKNQSTSHITRAQYAAAFSDVDNDRDWWDPTDWLDTAFYELVVDDLAATGNCFGMCLEAIYSRKGRSLLSQPLDRFTSFASFGPEVTVKHCYQVGAPAIWWFLGQFASGNTHDPVDVFSATRDAYNRGDNPVLCLSRNYDFSGSPHCVMPVAWDTTAKPWRMTICDPNDPQTLRTLNVDPDKNAFSYQGTKVNYSGGQWTGGRLHWMPFSVLSSRPRTPVWDAILLILDGAMLIVGSDVATHGLVDASGNDVHAFGQRALRELQQGHPANGFFIPVPGVSGIGATAGEVLIRPDAARLAAGAGRQAAGRVTGARPASPTTLSFRHTVRATRDGTFDYMIKDGLDAFGFQSATSAREATTVDVDDLGATASTFRVRPARERLMRFRSARRLGVGRDHLQVQVDGVPANAADGVNIAVRPGTGGLDIVPTRQQATARVEVSARINGRTTKRTFAVPLDGGVHLGLEGALEAGTISTGDIDAPLADPTTSVIVHASS